MHTNYSDGMNSPAEIASLAKKGGLNVISVTDHDRIDSIGKVVDACKPFGIDVIPGVEISTTFEGKPLHVLGYSIDASDAAFISFLRKINDFRRDNFIERMPVVNENLKRAGLKEADADKYKGRDPKYYSHPGLSLFLAEEGVISNPSEGFQYLKGVKGTTSPFGPKDAFDAIHKAGGIAVMSHPFAPKIAIRVLRPDRAGQEEVVALFKKQGLDGLECYQTGHGASDVEFCLEMAAKYKLIITAGSDWHGHRGPEDTGIREYLPYYIDELGDLAVPEEKVAEILKGLGWKQ